MENSDKFCPVCKNKNERGALVCIHCGAALDESFSDPTVTALSPQAAAEGAFVEARIPVDEKLIPENGVALYIAGVDKPVYMRIDSEVVLGRKVLESNESLLDLTELGGFQMGISRRHAKIRREGSGYEIIDLFSTNGTWIGNERLIPDKPYPIPNRSQVRLGRMRLLIFHRSVSEGRKP